MVTVTQHGNGTARARPRRDSVRNRRRLLDAAGDVLRTQPLEASMPLIAQKAELSVATAYRYFSTLDELHNAYMHQVGLTLRNYSDDSPRTGMALFEDVAGEWARLLRTYGTAMIQVRSRRGFIERLRAGDMVITTICTAWERPIRQVMRELQVPEDQFEYALSLYNALYDPREILDLMESGLSEEQVLKRLSSAYFGALRGWSAATKP
jgi:AcrR family transcriptional regulator